MYVQILTLQSANSIIHKAIKLMVCSSKENYNQIHCDNSNQAL